MDVIFTGTLTLNLASLRREILNGREYLIAPGTLIVPGVLPGSNGPLFYPPEEVARNVTAWNGVPLTNGHPAGPDGSPISARTPGVLSASTLGIVYAANILGDKLRADLYFDVALIRNIAPDLLPLLNSGKSIELSTGLFLELEKAPDGATHNGRAYSHIARNYRPDHVAILINGKGACGVSDGCGVFNQDPATGDNPVNRDQLIAYLSNNCDCWKGKSETLNKLSDDDLKALHGAAVVTVQNKQKLADADAQLIIVRNSLGVDALPVGNALAEALKAKTTPAPAPTPTQTPTPVPVGEKRQTLTELLANASPEERAVWAMANQIVVEKRSAMIEHILNASRVPEDKKPAQRLIYNKMGVDDLKQIVADIPQPQGIVGSVGNFHLPDPGYHAPVPSFAVNEDDILMQPSFVDYTAS